MRRNERVPTEAEARLTVAVATMTAYLTPYAGNPVELWAHMEEAFEAGMGRAVNKADAYDVTLCHAALAPFKMEA